MRISTFPTRESSLASGVSSAAMLEIGWRVVVVMQMQMAFFGDQIRGLNMAKTTGRNGGRVLLAGEKDGRPGGIEAKRGVVYSR